MASGTDLKVERIRARLSMKEVCARMGISRQSLWSLERAETVPAERARQYREALTPRDTTGNVE